MASTMRTRISGPKIPFGRRIPSGSPSIVVSIPTHFRCPISLELMNDPVMLSTGITYDRQSIETWLDMGNTTCPVTNQVLTAGEELIPNHSIRRMIQDWCVKNRSLGIERIPTPRIPVSSAQVSETLSEIASASRRGDRVRCLELVSKIKAAGKESERNRRCIVSNGAARVLAASFSAFASARRDSSTIGVMEEILSALTSMFPLDKEACRHITSPESLNSLASILKSGALAGRINAALVIRELVSSHKDRVVIVAEIEELIEALVKLIKEPISPQATKASLVSIFYLASTNEKTASRFVEMGLVPLVLEILVDTEKSICEKALGVFDELCSCELGREEAYDHALTVPLLVKKMFRVSEMATEFAVSALWKLCKNRRMGGTGCSVEALQVGAFQKLLLLLQVGCSEATKEKASDLLKLLNVSRGRLECIESMDFKGLKRPF